MKYLSVSSFRLIILKYIINLLIINYFNFVQSANWSSSYNALRHYYLANLYLSKLSSDTAFYKHLLASICIVTLSYEMTWVGFGKVGWNLDLEMAWSICLTDILDWGGGGTYWWTYDFFTYDFFTYDFWEVPDCWVFTCFIISMNFFLEYILRLFCPSSSLPNLFTTS